MNDSQGTGLVLLETGPTDSSKRIALAHGAGAPMDHPWMEAVAGRLSEGGIRVIRFEFPYMRRRRAEGGRRPPDRAPKLLDTWREVIERCGGGAGLVIGGKSMGGRMASLLADERDVAGLLCLGFPAHAPGRPIGQRIDHLAGIQTPTLIIQGERDPMGNRETFAGLKLSEKINVKWLPDGEHSFKPRKASGRTLEENLDSMAGWAIEFIEECASFGEA